MAKRGKKHGPKREALVGARRHELDHAFERLLAVLKVEPSRHAFATYVIARALDGVRVELLLDRAVILRLDKEDLLVLTADPQRIYLTAVPKAEAARTLKAAGPMSPAALSWFREHAHVVTDEPMLRSWIEWLKQLNGGTLG